MKRFPQELINVKVFDKHAVESNEAVAEVIAQEAQKLGDSGRILVRPSGTEPLVRVMVEAATHEEAFRVAETIAHVIEQQLGSE